MQLSFGSGAVWGERTDVTGSGIGPRQFGVLQDIQIDFDWTDKELYGQLQFPVAIARGQGKITGKAKFAQILGLPEMVQHAYIAGKLETDEGILGDQAIAIVPVEILCV